MAIRRPQVVILRPQKPYGVIKWTKVAIQRLQMTILRFLEAIKRPNVAQYGHVVVKSGHPEFLSSYPGVQNDHPQAPGGHQ